MLALEREIAYDMVGDRVRTEAEILREGADEAAIEKSDLTAMGVAVPDELGMEFGEGGLMDADRATPMMSSAGRDNRIADFADTYKTGSLVEFMEIESQVKQATMHSGTNVFVGDSFNRDDLADSVGTQLTEVLDSGKRVDDSILREAEER